MYRIYHRSAIHAINVFIIWSALSALCSDINIRFFTQKINVPASPCGFTGMQEVEMINNIEARENVGIAWTEEVDR